MQPLEQQGPDNSQSRNDTKRRSSFQARQAKHRVSQFSRANSEALVGKLTGEDQADSDRWEKHCGIWTNGNMRVLALTALLFGIITATQWIFAIMYHSKAMEADSVSMAVDAFTYFMNIFVEMLSFKYPDWHRKAQIIVPAISITVLTFFTIQLMGESMCGRGLLTCAEDEGEDNGDEPVSGWVMLIFAIWGILFDFASLFAFVKNAQANGEDKLGINMMAAFLHVGADFARSTVTFFAAIYIILKATGDADIDAKTSTAADEWASLGVGGLILAGAAYAVYEWILDIKAFMSGDEHEGGH